MYRIVLACLGFALLAVADSSVTTHEQKDTAGNDRQVVLLHGLGRTSRSMERMASALRQAGYAACNVDYPSRDYSIRELATDSVLPLIDACGLDKQQAIHFVTHSLGGIIVREIAAVDGIARIGRVVMLAPPNQGSEVVDVLQDNWLFEFINGPAGQELGTGPASRPNALGAARFEVGVITGNTTINPLLSTIIPGEDDGKVAVERAKLAGMQDFLVLPVTHMLIMQDSEVIEQTLLFLADGQFDHNKKTTNKGDL